MTTFAIRNTAVLSYAQGFTVWLYAHTGSLADVTAPGFFSDAQDMFKDGDHIHLKALDGGAVAMIVNRDKQVSVKLMCATVA